MQGENSYRMEDKYYYVFRFITQDRATKYLNKVVNQFEDKVIYTDMAEKSIEFDDAIYYFWDMLRDDGIQFDAEYDEKEFHKVMSDLLVKYA